MLNDEGICRENKFVEDYEKYSEFVENFINLTLYVKVIFIRFVKNFNINSSHIKFKI